MKKRFGIMIWLIVLCMCFLSACASGKSGIYEAATAVNDTAVAQSQELAMASNKLADAGLAEEPAEVVPEAIPSNRKLIRNVDLNVETTVMDELLAGLQSKIKELGGYVENSSIQGNSISGTSERRYATLVVRIPSAKLDLFLANVEQNGNVVHKSEGVTDVTLQYSDIESRKKTLVVEQDRLWALLSKAESMDAVIALEARLSEIRYELESFESQLRLYDNQIDYSTVTIYIDEVKVFSAIQPDDIGSRIQKGFSRNLQRVAEFGINFVIWMLSFSPVLVLLLVILLIAGTVYRGVHRMRNRRREKSTSAMPEIPENENQKK